MSSEPLAKNDLRPASPPVSQPSSLFDSAFLRRLESLTLLVRQARSGQWQGARRSLKRGQSVEFADYRPYVPGDDFRLVDWSAFARLERFFLKLFVEEEEQHLHLLIDTSRSMDWPRETSAAAFNKLAYAQKAAAALGYVALAGLDRVSVSAFDAGLTPALPPRRGRAQAAALFKALAALTPAGPTDLNQSLRQYAAQARQPGPLLIFSDLFETVPPSAAAPAPSSGPPGSAGLLALLSRRFEVTLIHLLSPDEADPVLQGDWRLLDSETGHSVEITADDEALSRYRAGLRAWQTELHRWCGRRGVSYVPVTTAVPFESFIFSFLRRQGVLK
ncbi:MAG TPA: DUF58 domain-containing protein [Anaerolineae bacterium]|nr:DUF58 domain-containing protein [Anaerolineae bacterium]